MALKYDFDIAAVPGAAPVAMWRDPAVVEALKRADPVVQKYFRDSGFGFATFDSGAPEGRFPAKDEQARADIIGKLTDNVGAVDMEGLDWGGFNLREFLGYLGSATPVEMAEVAPARKAVASVPSKVAAPAAPPAEPDIRVTDDGPDFEFDRDDLRRAMQPSKSKGIAMIVLALGVILIAVAALMALP